MFFFIKGCTFSTCRYYRCIIKNIKLFESQNSFLNLDRISFICKLFSTERNLSVFNTNIEKYLDHLMKVYQSEDRPKTNISEILNFQDIPLLLNEKIKIIENIKSLHELINGNEEMKNEAEVEESMYKQQILQIDKKILNVILEHLTSEHYENVIMEITPGVGGQEAMLFGNDLLQMYTSYFDYLGFRYEIIELIKSETNGLRKAVLVIFDKRAYKKLKYEGGVHRVQRIPSTEKIGRMHTSTAVVTVSPEPMDIDIKLEQKDLKIESKRSAGAGGQHVNTTDSAIRITHIPTGKVVISQISKSQIKNRQFALAKLKSLIYEEQLEKQTSFISELRKKQLGNRSRNEKIRTYNFNQDRVTDHRIPNGTIHNLKQFMSNGVALEELEDRLWKEMEQKILLEIIKMES